MRFILCAGCAFGCCPCRSRSQMPRTARVRLRSPRSALSVKALSAPPGERTGAWGWNRLRSMMIRARKARGGSHGVTGVEPCGYVDAEFAQDHGDGLVPVLQGVQIEPCVVGREGPDAFGREFFQNSGVDDIAAVGILFFLAATTAVRRWSRKIPVVGGCRRPF